MIKSVEYEYNPALIIKDRTSHLCLLGFSRSRTFRSATANNRILLGKLHLVELLFLQ